MLYWLLWQGMLSCELLSTQAAGAYSWNLPSTRRHNSNHSGPHSCVTFLSLELSVRHKIGQTRVVIVNSQFNKIFLIKCFSSALLFTVRAALEQEILTLGRGVIIIWYGRINGFKIIVAPARRVLQNNGDQFQNWLHGSVAPATCKLLVTFIYKKKKHSGCWDNR